MPKKCFITLKIILFFYLVILISSLSEQNKIEHETLVSIDENKGSNLGGPQIDNYNIQKNNSEDDKKETLNSEIINNDKININTNQTIECGKGLYNGTICICDKGYTYDDSNKCLYKQKKALTSLLVEIFTNIGIGHMIIGRTLFGIIKLMLGVIPWLVNILGVCSVIRVKPSEGVLGLIVSILLFISSLVFFVWWIVDAFLFGFNVYKDGNGKELEHW